MTTRCSARPSIATTTTVTGSLPEALTPLVEALAEHTHDNWVREREAQGWTWGPSRDDALKRHPDLVPYGELPEEEKRLDRATALGVLRFICGKGWRLLPPED